MVFVALSPVVEKGSIRDVKVIFQLVGSLPFLQLVSEGFSHKD